MAESDDESDFASAESEPEETESPPPTTTVAVDSTTAQRKPSERVTEVISSQPLSPVRDEQTVEDSQANIDDDNSAATATTTHDKDDPPQPEDLDVTQTKATSKSEDDGENRTISDEPPLTDQEKREGQTVDKDKETTEGETHVQKTESGQARAGGGGGGWGGWGGWGGLWSSVSTVTESAQALGHKVSSVIASVEDTLGLPSPHDLIEKEGGDGSQQELDDETSKLADEMVEHDIPPEDMPPIQEEPYSGSSSPTKDIPPPPPHPHQSEDHAQGDPEQQQQHSPSSFGGFSSFFTGIASAMQTTSLGIGKASLDVLETLGKKTFEVLSEGDPGLQKTRSTLAGSKGPTLSQLLLEAKTSSDRPIPAVDCISKLPLSYSRLFDEYHGVVHLEALELLSKECERKIRGSLVNISGDDLRALKARMEEVHQAFEVEEQPEVLDDDSSQLHEILELFSNMALPLKVDRLIKVSESWRDKVEIAMSPEQLTEEPAKVTGEGGEGGEATEVTGEGGEGGEATKVAGEGGEPTSEIGEGGEGGEAEGSGKGKTAVFETLYENGISSLAEMTSTSIELFRKMGEVLLLPDSQRYDLLEQAQKFNRLTVLVSSELDSLASVHAEAITQLDLKDCNSNITSLYLEASNSSTYVQDAFQLLCPVLKHTLLQQLQPLQQPSSNVLGRS